MRVEQLNTHHDVNLSPPGNLMTASNKDLDALGIFLLSRIVRDIRHMEISGVTYMSFIA